MRTTLFFIVPLFFLSLNLNAQEKSVADLLYEAIYAEEITGELDQATKLYKQVLKEYADQRQECAQALYHLGIIAEKGQKAKMAKSHYDVLVNQYAEIGEYAGLARKRIQILDDATTFIDPRDGHKYKYVEIGDQTWMAENLAYLPHVNPPKKQENGIWVYDYDGHDVAEAKATENYQKYGCLYDWTMAMDINPKYLESEWVGDAEDHQGICPPGWKLPSEKDWSELEVLLGLAPDYDERDDPWNLGIRDACGGLKLKSTQGWTSGGNGSDFFGMNIIPGGFRRIEKESTWGFKEFQNIGESASYWYTRQFHYSDSLFNEPPIEPFIWAFERNFNNLDRDSKASDDISRFWSEKTSGSSVRCIKSLNPKESNNKESYLEKLAVLSKQTKPIEPKYIAILPELLHSIPRHDTLDRTFSWSIIHDNLFIIWTKTDSLITAYDTGNYKEAWSVKHFINGGGSSTLMHDNNTLIFSDKQEIIYLDLSTGKQINSFPFPDIELMQIENEDILIGRSFSNKGHTMYGIDKRDGSKKWEYRCGDSIRLSSPSANNELIFFGLTPDFRIREDYFKTPNTAFFALDIKTGEIKWTFKSKSEVGHRSPMILKNQLIMMHYGEQYVYSFNPVTGEQNWKYYMDHSGSSDFISLDDKLYFYDNHFFWGISQAYCIDLTGKEIWKKTLLENQSPSKISQFMDTNKLLISLGSSTQGKHLLIINQGKDGSNWILEKPKSSIGNFTFTMDKIFLPTSEGILVYKYPDFKE